MPYRRTRRALVLVVPILLAASAAQAADLVVVSEEHEGGVRFRASNPTAWPISVLLEIDDLRNLQPDRPLPLRAVVEPHAERTLLALSRGDPRQPSSHGPWRWLSQPGRIDAVHDDGVTYELPYPPGYAWFVEQGYDGSFSHRGESSLDFSMPPGNAVHAARGGRVVRVVERFDESGPTRAADEFANFVWILHDDGTIGRYVHLEPRGADVEVGQRVRTGDRVGRSGSTGWSRGPHLHFDVVVPAGDVRGLRTLPVRFRTDEGPRVSVEEGTSPMRPIAGAAKGRLPVNALARIVLARGATRDNRPRDVTDRFSRADTVHVFFEIGARRAYAVRVAFGAPGAARPGAVRTLRTESDWDRAWVGQDLASLNLGGERRCRVRVYFDGEPVGETTFRVD